MILNGIGEMATRGDLLDRSLLVELPVIGQGERRTERELGRRFEAARPRILGALLDATAGAIRELPSVRLAESPRMADFAEWAVAASPALGWSTDRFMGAYGGNRAGAHELTLESSPIAPAVRAVAAGGGFEGSATDLLDRLAELDAAAAQRRGWPAAPSSLGTALRRIAPNLRAVGVDVDFQQGTRQRVISVKTNGSNGDSLLFSEDEPAAAQTLDVDRHA